MTSGFGLLACVCLRHVLKRVGRQYEVPYNRTSHSSPDTQEDMKNLRDYLRTHSIQTYTRGREFNDDTPEARDFIAKGGAYNNTPKAFSTFTRDTCKASYKAQSSLADVESESDGEDNGTVPDPFHDAIEAYNGELTLEDLEDEDLDIEGTLAAMRAMAQNLTF